MIDITLLKETDIGRWVRYDDGFGNAESGRILSFSTEVIFVVYKCGGNWLHFDQYTAEATDPEDLNFINTGAEALA